MRVAGRGRHPQADARSAKLLLPGIELMRPFRARRLKLISPAENLARAYKADVAHHSQIGFEVWLM